MGGVGRRLGSPARPTDLMTTPTAAEIKSWSKIDFASLGFATNEQLQVLVDRTAALFTSITGRALDASIPTEFVALAQQAVQRMTEILAFQSTQDFVETLSDFQLISSFSAGSYSETRRSLTEIRDARMLTADPGLNSLLIGLLTPDQLDFWMAWWSGIPQPGFEVTEVDWSATLADPLLHNVTLDPVTGATIGPWSL